MASTRASGCCLDTPRSATLSGARPAALAAASMRDRIAARWTWALRRAWALKGASAMGSIAVLAALAARLNREAGGPPIPSLYFFTDPARTPDPVAVAERLPQGAAVVFHHFGKPGRLFLARKLARVCRARGLKLLIASDPVLARRVSADGVHWPEKRAPKQRRGEKLQIIAAHSRRAIERAAIGRF